MGVSPRYTGDGGRAYADWQLRAVDIMGKEAARRFRPYVYASDDCLDFGCGGGSILAALKVASRRGVEPNEQPRINATRRGIDAVASLADVPSESVDVVISNHALEHCRSPFEELTQMQRVLRPQGRLVLVLPMDDWRRSRRFLAQDINDHLYAWAPLHIGNLVTDVGLHVDSVDIIRHAYPLGVRLLWQGLPEMVFDVICGVWSVLFLRRQIRVVAHRP